MTTAHDIDRELLAAVRHADRGAFAALYDRYAPWLLGVALRILRNRGDAEDLIHDVFLEVWHKAGAYDPERGSVRRWLVTRLRSRAIDRLRASGAQARQMTLAAADDAGIETSNGEFARYVDYQRARRAMAQLSDEQRTALELAYFGGLTTDEIAQRCAIPAGTVKSRLAAAIAVLRRLMTEPRSDADDH